MDGVQLGARFSLATNRLRYCGPAEAAPTLYRAITEGTGQAEAAASLRKFEALYPYLESIGRLHGLDPFDRKVVEAYWIGNELLDDFPRPEFARLLDALAGRGLPPFLARELVDRLPPSPLPHHVFHVAYVGVGAVTGHVPTNLRNMELCRPSWGSVVGVESPDRLRVAGPTLAATGEGLSLEDGPERSVRYDPACLPGVRAGDVVAVHWEWAAMTLSGAQRDALERYTRRSLEEANRTFASGR